MDNYRRAIKNIDVIDGDTIRAEIDLGFGHLWQREGKKNKPTIRLLGVNAPETTRRGSWDDDLTEAQIEALIQKGKASHQQLQMLLANASKVWIYSPNWSQDSFGRTLAYVYADIDGQFVNVGSDLIENGMAVEYGKPLTNLLGSDLES